MTLGALLKTQREKRKLDTLSFAVFLGLLEPELLKVEADEATVSNDRAEYWAELLSVSRVETVQLALEARMRGAKPLTEPLSGYEKRATRSSRS